MSYEYYTCITELILVFQILYLYYGSYTCLTGLILVFRSTYLYFRSYACISELILVFQILCLYYRTYTYFTDTEVPVGTITSTKGLVGTTGLLLILQNLYLYY